VHANLPQNASSGTPLAQMLANGRAVAMKNGIPWKGLDINVSGSDVLPPGPLDQALLENFEKQACRADAIVIGYPSGSSAYHLSAGGTTVYGDHIFVLQEVLKDNPAAPIGSRKAIVVTRPGGALVISGDPVHVSSGVFPALQAGKSYLLFLRYIPQSGAYHAIDSFSTLSLNQDNWVLYRNGFGGVPVPGLTRGGVADTVGSWVQSCI
jgi:hypothetical protein